MIDLTNIENIYFYKERCDLRMSINGLSILAQELIELSLMKHTLFIFYGRSKKNIKIIELDSDGWWLYQKKLSVGSFNLPVDIENNSISKFELELFLNGQNIIKYRLHKNSSITINY